jgi:O-antigen/teichoic acid export membrane protein
MTKTISQNTSYLTIASVLQKVLAFAYFTVLANSIGVEGTGKYFFALSFTTIFVVFIDLGFTNVFVREAAKSKETVQSYLSTLLVFKLGMSVLTYAALGMTIHLLGYPADTRLLVYVSGITMIFDTLHLSLYGALRALGDLRYEGIGMAVSQFGTLLLGSLFLWMELPLVYLILAFTIPSALNVLFAASILIIKFQVPIILEFNKKLFRQLSIIAIPFAVAAVLSRIYSYADTMILSRMLGDAAVGIYSIPYKITFAFQFIPMALIAAVYPKFSELYVSDKQRLVYIFEHAMMYLLIIAVPITVGIFVLASDIITLLYADAYLASIVPLQILILSLLVSFISFPIGALLNACDRQVAQTKIVALALIINITFNLLLIPNIGVSGAAIAAVVGNIVLTFCGYYIASSIITMPHWNMILKLSKIILAGVCMGVAVVLVRSVVPLTISIGIGACVYPLCLYVFRVVTPLQLKQGMALIRS